MWASGQHVLTNASHLNLITPSLYCFQTWRTWCEIIQHQPIVPMFVSRCFVVIWNECLICVFCARTFPLSLCGSFVPFLRVVLFSCREDLRKPVKPPHFTWTLQQNHLKKGICRDAYNLNKLICIMCITSDVMSCLSMCWDYRCNVRWRVCCYVFVVLFK